jgi:hypothetical protein
MEGVAEGPSAAPGVAVGRQRWIEGVEIRQLPAEHFLSGGLWPEKGLFATRHFEKCDILGEYCGRVVESDNMGHYVAALVRDTDTDESVGVDAEECGNECRYINCYVNVAEKANVVLRTAYIDNVPHLAVGEWLVQ